MPTPLSLILNSTTNAGNLGQHKGSANFTVSGDGQPFHYFFSNGTTWSDDGGTDTIDDLTAGFYWLTVVPTPGAGYNPSQTIQFFITACVLTADFVIQNPQDGQSDGSAQVVITGNTGTLSYLWSNGATTQTINNIAAGTYTVTATDTDGCTITASITVLGQTQGLINMLTCCSGDLAYKYVWAAENGIDNECIGLQLILLQGYIGDICGYVAGDCLTAAQYETAKENAQTLCSCCGDCNDIYYDGLRQ